MNKFQKKIRHVHNPDDFRMLESEPAKWQGMEVVADKKKTPWSESASELYRPSNRRLSAKWLPTFEDRGCHVFSVTDPYGRILGFLDRSRYFSIK
jgi:hypothetical protein